MTSAASQELGRGRGHRWRVDADHVDMSVPSPQPRPVAIDAQPQKVTVDLERSAIIIVDMQNDFGKVHGGSPPLALGPT